MVRPDASHQKPTKNQTRQKCEAVVRQGASKTYFSSGSVSGLVPWALLMLCIFMQISAWADIYPLCVVTFIADENATKGNNEAEHNKVGMKINIHRRFQRWRGFEVALTECEI